MDDPADEAKGLVLLVKLDDFPDVRLFIWAVTQVRDAMEKDLAYLDAGDPARPLLAPHYDALEGALRRFSGGSRGPDDRPE